LAWSSFGAWQEILARIFEGFEVREDFSPSWMVNPYTGRRLKLDRYYPELGIALRFVGGLRTQNRRVSDEEWETEEKRDAIREWLCEKQGVALVRIDPEHTEPRQQVWRIRAALSHTSRMLAQSDVSLEYKRTLAPRIAAARRRCEEIARRLNRPEDLRQFAELWQDRNYALLTHEPPPASEGAGAARCYRAGMRVHHATFGPGLVREVQGQGEDARILVLFDDGRERQFLAGLVGDKLLPE